MNHITQNKSLLVCLGGKKFAICENFKQASEAISKLIAYENLGATAFYKKKNIGIILHPEKGPFAYVSYNGKVWKGIDIISNNNEQITNLSSCGY